jgi:hypothetical protein
MPRKTGALLLLILLTLVAMGCDEVQVDYDKTANFAAYRTFAWLAVDPNDKRMLERDFPKAAERIKAAINRELTDRGLAVSAPEEAHLLVSYRVVLDIQRAGRTTGVNLADDNTGVPVWSSGGGSVTAYQDPIKKGTLIFRMDDRGRGEPVWQGQFSKKFRHPSDLEPADIRRLIQRLFRDFPS